VSYHFHCNRGEAVTPSEHSYGELKLRRMLQKLAVIQLANQEISRS